MWHPLPVVQPIQFLFINSIIKHTLWQNARKLWENRYWPSLVEKIQTNRPVGNKTLQTLLSYITPIIIINVGAVYTAVFIQLTSLYWCMFLTNKTTCPSALSVLDWIKFPTLVCIHQSSTAVKGSDLQIQMLVLCVCSIQEINKLRLFGLKMTEIFGFDT